MADHVRQRSGIPSGPFGKNRSSNSAGIGMISMAMAAPTSLNNKRLALPNVKNLRRLLTYYVVSQLNCYLPF